MTQFFEVKKLTETAHLPEKAHVEDAGWDLYADEDIILHSYETKLVSTGIALALPSGYAGLIWDRSSLGVKGIHRHAGVIDSGYRGEVKVALKNTHDKSYVISTGDRIAQLIIQETPDLILQQVDELSKTVRDTGSFGSTGK